MFVGKFILKHSKYTQFRREKMTFDELWFCHFINRIYEKCSKILFLKKDKKIKFVRGHIIGISLSILSYNLIPKISQITQWTNTVTDKNMGFYWVQIRFIFYLFFFSRMQIDSRQQNMNIIKHLLVPSFFFPFLFPFSHPCILLSTFYSQNAKITCSLPDCKQQRKITDCYSLSITAIFYRQNGCKIPQKPFFVHSFSHLTHEFIFSFGLVIFFAHFPLFIYHHSDFSILRKKKTKTKETHSYLF